MINLTKYHGLGNDFIIIKETEVVSLNYNELAKKVCHRHTGIGADGLIIVKEKPLTMMYYNSDGSIAKMCGNGIRCFSKYCYDEGIINETDFTVQTLAGDYQISRISNTPFIVKVNMKKPLFNTKDIPMNTTKKTFVNEEVNINDKSYKLTSLSMGATHTVIEVESLAECPIEEIGKHIQSLSLYPKSTNVNIYERINETTIKLLTYERGAGLTYACGTGATATYAVYQKLHNYKGDLTIKLPLGKLTLSTKNNSIYMEGPAEKILDGQYKEVNL
ncbi:MAG: diaminopimelate epimerase [Candidatus Izimaplasma sp.]|nr:diaminopimelate epimerase [Candidatus Izimaplasma bacterium]